MNSSTHSADVFIVGGGPAGLATAILAAKRGLRVAVADHNGFPIDKACGEGLMPDTLTALKTLDIDLSHRDAIRFRGIRFREAESANSVEGEFGQSFGLGIRRTVLHAKLAERAAELGVALLWGSRVTLNGDGRILCQGEPVRSNWVIGAELFNTRAWFTDAIWYRRIPVLSGAVQGGVGGEEERQALPGTPSTAWHQDQSCAGRQGLHPPAPKRSPVRTRSRSDALPPQQPVRPASHDVSGADRVSPNVWYAMA